jgi:hypothetical protein
VINIGPGDSYPGRTASNVCPRDLLAQKYYEALSETRPTTLYAENTIYHVERIQRLFEESVSIVLGRSELTLTLHQVLRSGLSRSETDSARVCHGSNGELSALVALNLYD